MFNKKWKSQFTTYLSNVIDKNELGGGYDGNSAKKILDGVDKLSVSLPISCAPIVDSLRAFRNVVQGWKKIPGGQKEWSLVFQL